MDESCLQFHIEENDYFGTLATVLDLVRQDLDKRGDIRNRETLVRLRDRLMHLQKGYRIARIEPINDSESSARHARARPFSEDRGSLRIAKRGLRSGR